MRRYSEKLWHCLELVSVYRFCGMRFGGAMAEPGQRKADVQREGTGFAHIFVVGSERVDLK